MQAKDTFTLSPRENRWKVKPFGTIMAETKLKKILKKNL